MNFVDALYYIDIWCAYLLIVLLFLYIISGLDDAFIDLTAFVKKLRPQKMAPRVYEAMISRKESRIAIMIPAWHEANVITHVIEGNLDRIRYSAFDIYIGIYPNDQGTCLAVQKLEEIYPNVHGVVNERDGPTSKGQMLNQIIQYIRTYEQSNKVTFTTFLMQDAEDAIHPLALKLINFYARAFDFIQIPVFSLPVKLRRFIAGTYVDEFAEFHTKDILVRSALGAPVPSAGVGTALSRSLVLKTLVRYGGKVFNEGSVTEDYELGMRSQYFGFNSIFLCLYTIDPITGQKDFIATREYFPRRLVRSIRQKSRWTIGIAFQGTKNLGWFGNRITRYFLYRDRKGPAANIVAFLGYICFFEALAADAVFDTSEAYYLLQNPAFEVLFGMNIVLMTNRFYQRSKCVARVYGFWLTAIVPLRWPVGIFVNAMASMSAIKKILFSTVSRKTIAWVKTEHELPDFPEAKKSQTANGSERSDVS